MQKSTKWLLVGGTAGTASALVAAYGTMVRPWHLTWGATFEEAHRAMPFDELIPDPNYVATRAITVDAPAEIVWKYVTERSSLPVDTIVRHVEMNRCVVFAPPELEAEATWVVTLEPRDGATRVVSRNRAHFGHTLSAIVRYLLVDVGQFWFERRWLLRVKARSEALQNQMKITELVP
jgi:hypothetical protein